MKALKQKHWLLSSASGSATQTAIASRNYLTGLKNGEVAAPFVKGLTRVN